MLNGSLFGKYVNNLISSALGFLRAKLVNTRFFSLLS